MALEVAGFARCTRAASHRAHFLVLLPVLTVEKVPHVVECLSTVVVGTFIEIGVRVAGKRHTDERCRRVARVETFTN